MEQFDSSVVATLDASISSLFYKLAKPRSMKSVQEVLFWKQEPKLMLH